MTGLAERARAFAALGEESRLAIVDLLALGDQAPGELGARLGIPTNLMAHHLHMLEQAGLVVRRRSEGDGRRTYVQRTRACNELIGVAAGPLPRPRRVAFVCSANSARSPLSEAYWRTVSDIPVASAGTHPADRVHPGAVAVAGRHGLDLAHAVPRRTRDVLAAGDLLVAVCDRAYEELDDRPLHWSVADPAAADDPTAFDAAYEELTGRVDLLAASFATHRG